MASINDLKLKVISASLGTTGSLNDQEKAFWAASLNAGDFVKVGTTSPAIQMKKLTGTTGASEGGQTTLAHGLNRLKILGVEVLVQGTTTTHLQNQVTSVGNQYTAFVNNTNVVIALDSTNSENLLSKAITVLLTYEE